jgi:hypothetical protein
MEEEINQVCFEDMEIHEVITPLSDMIQGAQVSDHIALIDDSNSHIPENCAEITHPTPQHGQIPL